MNEDRELTLRNLEFLKRMLTLQITQKFQTHGNKSYLQSNLISWGKRQGKLLAQLISSASANLPAVFYYYFHL
jgi:hypothetical protein